MIVLLDIAVDNTLNDPFVGFRSFPDRTRFEQQKNSLSCVPIRVILATDLMNDAMTECQVSESSGWARCRNAIILKSVSNLMRDHQMIRVSLAINQICPIEITATCPFTSGKRSEYNKARIVRCVP